MQERGQNRLSGFRKAAGSAVLAMSIAACGNNATETPKPTVLPTEQPTPTLIVTPSPEVTATPIVTPEVTATPEPTPVPIGNLIDQIITNAETNGWTKVSEQDVLNSINKAYENDPEAAAFINPLTNELHEKLVYNNWEFCSSATDLRLKKTDCGALEGILYYGAYTVDTNEAWIKPISMVVNYAHQTLNSQDFQGFVNIASSQKPPF